MTIKVVMNIVYQVLLKGAISRLSTTPIHICLHDKTYAFTVISA